MQIQQEITHQFRGHETRTSKRLQIKLEILDKLIDWVIASIPKLKEYGII